MTLTNPYRQKNYMGEYANDAAALVFIQANKWDDTNDGTGDPQAGMTYFDTVNTKMKAYSGTAWEFLGLDVAAGSAGQVQFNDTGADFGADADFHWDNINKRLGLGTAVPGGTLGFLDGNTYITRDGGNNLSFTDAVTGTKTLAQLASMSAPSLDDAYNQGSSIDVDTAAVTMTVSDTDNNAALILVQNDVSNNPNALEITNLGAGSAIALAGAGNRRISSSAGNFTLQTIGTGDLVVTVADDLDLDADSINIRANDNAGALDIIADNTLGLSAVNSMTISSDSISMEPAASITGTFLTMTGQTLVGASGIDVWTYLYPTIAQSGTAGYTVLKLNAIQSTTGSGAKLLIDAQADNATVFSVSATGAVSVIGDITTIQAIGRDTDNEIAWTTDDQLDITIGGSTTAIASITAGVGGDNDKLVTQGYVDDAVATVDTWAEVLALGNTSGGTNPTISKNDTIDFLGATSGTISLAPVAVAGTNTLSLPAATDTLVGKATGDVFTNKSISFTTNTISGTAAEFDTACSDDNFAYVSDNLSVFAATTSLQLAGVISDETGSGALVFGTSPALTTPTGIVASDIVIAGGFGTPTYDDVADFIDYTQSSGRLTGGVISDGGGGTIDISEFEGMIISGSSIGDPIVFFKRAAEVGLSLAGDGVNFILATYNAGTIDYSASLTRPALDTHGQFVVGRVYKSGTDVEIANTGQNIYNQYGRMQDRLLSKYGFMDRASGGVVSAHATPLRLQADAGSWYTANTQFATAAADTFHVWYKSGSSTWQESAALTLFSEVFDGGTSTVYNTYQNGTALASLSQYGVYWIFICPDGDLYVVLGTSNYSNVANAQAAEIPSSLPPYCVDWAKFVGKVIISKQGAAFYSVESAFSTAFTLSAAVDHASLFDLGWTVSGHTGTVSTLAGFSGAGAAAIYSLSGTGTTIPTTVAPTFTTSITVTGIAAIDSGGVDLVTGHDYQINNASVLNASTLGSGVTASSLTSVGTLTTLQVDNININGNTISSTSGNINILPVAGSITQIGDAGSTNHTLNTNDDLFISGRLEVDGIVYLDEDVNIGSDLWMPGNGRLAVNSMDSYGGLILLNTNQTPNALSLVTGTVYNGILICEYADRAVAFNHALATDPTIWQHSADGTDITQWRSSCHNQTDSFDGIGTGSKVTEHEAPVSLADDAYFDLPDASSGYGSFSVDDGEAFAMVQWTTAGVVTIIYSNGSVSNGDDNGFFCFFDNGTSVRVRNRLGSAKTVMFDYHYTTSP